MIDHVSITVRDLESAGRFYDAVMAALGHARVTASRLAIGYGPRKTGDDRAYISVVKSEGVVTDRRHWAFVARDRSAVDRFHQAAIEAGGRDDGPPGLRPDYHPHYYGAFVTDPDGNRLEAVCHRAP